jgi:NAD(P)-dependent dehydrogenase (short-subunit alcohol dehydrogenase family)
MKERAGRVENKVAIVTGAGSTPGPGVGTGKAISVVLAREGAKVLLVDIHPDRAEQTQRMIEDEGGKAKVFRADVTRSDDCKAMVEAAVDTFGTLDILVNNLGLASFGNVVDLSEEEWQRAFDINARTVFLASKHAIPVMARKGSGAIVNLSSSSAVRAGGTVAYSAAKAGVIAMTTDMAFFHGRQGIRVNAVIPGMINTPIAMSVLAAGPQTDYVNRLRAESNMLGTQGDAWDIAWATLFLASDEARWITGVALPVDAGQMKLGPLTMFNRLREIPAPKG